MCEYVCIYICSKAFSLKVFKNSNYPVCFETKLKNQSQTTRKNTDLPFIHSCLGFLVFLSLREQISLHIVVGFDKQTTNSKLNSWFLYTRETGGYERVSYTRAHSGMVWEMIYSSTDENKAPCLGSEQVSPLRTPAPGCGLWVLERTQGANRTPECLQPPPARPHSSKCLSHKPWGTKSPM